MSYQKIGFIFSVLLHLFFAPLLFYINKPISHKSKIIALNFELNSIFIEGAQDADTETTDITEEANDKDPGPANKAQEIKSVVKEEPALEKVTQIVQEEETTLVEEVQEVKNAVEEEPLPEKIVKIIKKVEPDPVYTKSVTKQDVNEKYDELRDISKPESDSQKVTQNYASQYVRKHFDYINKLICLNISYPGRARKMLMEGSVIVSFVVRLDGSIKDIIIKQSSGYSILDRNAIKAIKKAAPFPSPPVEATITIPITYRLGA
ncbi:MAG: energy transducer TonB [Planctomycetes bacterium]|nr:energy transducer TonB [Planctomycetota bacterium]